MPDISLITSLYKTEQFLPQYVEEAKKIAREVKAAGLELEFILVPNEASEEERRLLTELDKYLITEQIATLQIHYVALETLYASWNRGLSFAKSDVFGLWNVDDVRTAEGLIEGFNILANDADMVDFAIKIQKQGVVKQHPACYQADSLAPAKGVGPFFMFHRRLYEIAGEFIPHFRITGDFEWSKRSTVRHSRTVSSDIVAGTFFQHEDNLSGAASNEWIEFNIALLIHDAPQIMRPVNPELMRKTWETWGHQYASISNETADWLWGSGAKERYEGYQRERRLPVFVRRILFALARRGILRSVDWDVHHGKDTPGS